jgi:hypothetical protein
MAAKVFFSVSMSLDGFIAPQERANDLGGEGGRDNDIARESFERTGVDASRVALEPVRAEPTQQVTHLTYAVRER